MLNEAN
jgi:hypothetical protein